MRRKKKKRRRRSDSSKLTTSTALSLSSPLLRPECRPSLVPIHVGGSGDNQEESFCYLIDKKKKNQPRSSSLSLGGKQSLSSTLQHLLILVNFFILLAFSPTNLISPIVVLTECTRITRSTTTTTTNTTDTDNSSSSSHYYVHLSAAGSTKSATPLAGLQLSWPRPPSPQQPTQKNKQRPKGGGGVGGAATQLVAAFLGIPYAAPPTSLLRLMPPGAVQPVTSHQQQQHSLEWARLEPSGRRVQVRSHSRFGLECVHLPDWLDDDDDDQHDSAADQAATAIRKESRQQATPATTSSGNFSIDSESSAAVGGSFVVTESAQSSTKKIKLQSRKKAEKAQRRAKQGENCLNLNIFIPLASSGSSNVASGFPSTTTTTSKPTTTTSSNQHDQWNFDDQAHKKAHTNAAAANQSKQQKHKQQQQQQIKSNYPTQESELDQASFALSRQQVKPIATDFAAGKHSSQQDSVNQAALRRLYPLPKQEANALLPVLVLIHGYKAADGLSPVYHKEQIENENQQQTNDDEHKNEQTSPPSVEGIGEQESEEDRPSAAAAAEAGAVANSLAHASTCLATNSIVVTFNYRIGLLGFLPYLELEQTSHTVAGGGGEHVHRHHSPASSHSPLPSSSGGSSSPSSGNSHRHNHALWDHIGLLHWLKHNAASFNGDSRNLTLMAADNQAAELVQLLALSPLAKGLFQRIILVDHQVVGLPLPTPPTLSGVIGRREEVGVASSSRKQKNQSQARNTVGGSSSSSGDPWWRHKFAQEFQRTIESLFREDDKSFSSLTNVSSSQLDLGENFIGGGQLSSSYEFVQLQANLSQLALIERRLSEQSLEFFELLHAPTLDDKLLFPQLVSLQHRAAAAGKRLLNFLLINHQQHPENHQNPNKYIIKKRELGNEQSHSVSENTATQSDDQSGDLIWSSLANARSELNYCAYLRNQVKVYTSSSNSKSYLPSSASAAQSPDYLRLIGLRASSRSSQQHSSSSLNLTPQERTTKSQQELAILKSAPSQWHSSNHNLSTTNNNQSRSQHFSPHSSQVKKLSKLKRSLLGDSFGQLYHLHLLNQLLGWFSHHHYEDSQSMRTLSSSSSSSTVILRQKSEIPMSSVMMLMDNDDDDKEEEEGSRSETMNQVETMNLLKEQNFRSQKKRLIDENGSDTVELNPSDADDNSSSSSIKTRSIFESNRQKQQLRSSSDTQAQLASDLNQLMSLLNSFDLLIGFTYQLEDQVSSPSSSENITLKTDDVRIKDKDKSQMSDNNPTNNKTNLLSMRNLFPEKISKLIYLNTNEQHQQASPSMSIMSNLQHETSYHNQQRTLSLLRFADLHFIASYITNESYTQQFCDIPSMFEEEDQNHHSSSTSATLGAAAANGSTNQVMNSRGASPRRTFAFFKFQVNHQERIWYRQNSLQSGLSYFIEVGDPNGDYHFPSSPLESHDMIHEHNQQLARWPHYDSLSRELKNFQLEEVRQKDDADTGGDMKVGEDYFKKQQSDPLIISQFSLALQLDLMPYLFRTWEELVVAGQLTQVQVKQQSSIPIEGAQNGTMNRSGLNRTELDVRENQTIEMKLASCLSQINASLANYDSSANRYLDHHHRCLVPILHHFRSQLIQFAGDHLSDLKRKLLLDSAATVEQSTNNSNNKIRQGSSAITTRNLLDQDHQSSGQVEGSSLGMAESSGSGDTLDSNNNNNSEQQTKTVNLMSMSSRGVIYAESDDHQPGDASKENKTPDLDSAMEGQVQLHTPSAVAPTGWRAFFSRSYFKQASANPLLMIIVAGCSIFLLNLIIVAIIALKSARTRRHRVRMEEQQQELDRTSAAMQQQAANTTSDCRVNFGLFNGSNGAGAELSSCSSAVEAAYPTQTLVKKPSNLKRRAQNGTITGLNNGSRLSETHSTAATVATSSSGPPHETPPGSGCGATKQLKFDLTNLEVPAPSQRSRSQTPDKCLSYYHHHHDHSLPPTHHHHQLSSALATKAGLDDNHYLKHDQPQLLETYFIPDTYHTHGVSCQSVTERDQDEEEQLVLRELMFEGELGNFFESPQLVGNSCAGQAIPLELLGQNSPHQLAVSADMNYTSRTTSSYIQDQQQKPQQNYFQQQQNSPFSSATITITNTSSSQCHAPTLTGSFRGGASGDRSYQQEVRPNQVEVDWLIEDLSKDKPLDVTACLSRHSQSVGGEESSSALSLTPIQLNHHHHHHQHYQQELDTTSLVLEQQQQQQLHLCNVNQESTLYK